jgi:RNA ligase (TIGR02306 family)
MEINRKLATVETILEIAPVPGANNIEKAKVRGWWVVVGKGQFKPGDACLYFEIDSLLPVYNPMFAGLEKYNSIKTCNGVTGYRIRTVKMRGQISQGLVLPYTGDLPHGTDLTEQLGIVKYEPYDVRLRSDNGAEGLFPSFIPKTDEERVQNLDIATLVGKTFTLHEKLDGTSFTAFKIDGELKVCSRNLILRKDDSSIYWRIAARYKLSELIPDGFAVQGEIVGDGIQGNPLKLKGQELYLFYAYDIVGMCYVEDFDIALKHAPFIETVTIGDSTTIDTLINYADSRHSLITPTAQCEGVVYSRFVNGQKESFKVINNKFLLKEKL